MSAKPLLSSTITITHDFTLEPNTFSTIINSNSNADTVLNITDLNLYESGFCLIIVNSCATHNFIIKVNSIIVMTLLPFTTQQYVIYKAILYRVAAMDNSTNINSQQYLKANGSISMTNNLNLADNKIINLANPTVDQDAATKEYVDSISSGLTIYLRINGTSVMEGNININNYKLINLSNPTDPEDASNKSYVDASILSIHKSLPTMYLQLSGDYAMQGILDMGSHCIINLVDPVNAQDATSKVYVDTAITNLGNIYLPLSGTVSMKGVLNMGMYGIQNVVAPVNQTDAATKEYVDTSISVFNIALPSLYLKLDGSNKMLNQLDCNTFKITNVANPTSAQDAVTLNYMNANSWLTSGNIVNAILQLGTINNYAYNLVCNSIPLMQCNATDINVVQPLIIGSKTNLTEFAALLLKQNLPVTNTATGSSYGLKLVSPTNNLSYYMGIDGSSRLVIGNYDTVTYNSILIMAPDMLLLNNINSNVAIGCNTINIANTCRTYFGTSLSYMQWDSINNLSLFSETGLNMQAKKITNVLNPTTAQDAVTLSYMNVNSWLTSGNTASTILKLGTTTNYSFNIICNNTTVAQCNETDINVVQPLIIGSKLSLTESAAFVLKQNSVIINTSIGSSYGLKIVSPTNNLSYYMGIDGNNKLVIGNYDTATYSTIITIAPNTLLLNNINSNVVMGCNNTSTANTCRTYFGTSTNYMQWDSINNLSLVSEVGLNMQEKKITNLLNPTAAQDAVTLSYIHVNAWLTSGNSASSTLQLGTTTNYSFNIICNNTTIAQCNETDINVVQPLIIGSKTGLTESAALLLKQSKPIATTAIGSSYSLKIVSPTNNLSYYMGIDGNNKLVIGNYDTATYNTLLTMAPDTLLLNNINSNVAIGCNTINIANTCQTYFGTSANYMQWDNTGKLSLFSESGLNMQSQKITNLLNPTNNQDAVTLNYLTTNIANQYLFRQSLVLATLSATVWTRIATFTANSYGTYLCAANYRNSAANNGLFGLTFTLSRGHNGSYAYTVNPCSANTYSPVVYLAINGTEIWFKNVNTTQLDFYISIYETTVFNSTSQTFAIDGVTTQATAPSTVVSITDGPYNTYVNQGILTSRKYFTTPSLANGVWTRLATISGTEGSVINFNMNYRNSNGQGKLALNTYLYRSYNGNYTYKIDPWANSGTIPLIAMNYSEIWVQNNSVGHDFCCNFRILSESASIAPTTLTIDGVTTQTAAPTGVIDLNNGAGMYMGDLPIRNVANPSQPQDVATLSYVQARRVTSLNSLGGGGVGVNTKTYTITSPLFQGYNINQLTITTSLLCEAFTDTFTHVLRNCFVNGQTLSITVNLYRVDGGGGWGQNVQIWTHVDM